MKNVHGRKKALLLEQHSGRPILKRAVRRKEEARGDKRKPGPKRRSKKAATGVSSLSCPQRTTTVKRVNESQRQEPIPRKGGHSAQYSDSDFINTAGTKIVLRKGDLAPAEKRGKARSRRVKGFFRQ